MNKFTKSIKTNRELSDKRYFMTNEYNTYPKVKDIKQDIVTEVNINANNILQRFSVPLITINDVFISPKVNSLISKRYCKSANYLVGYTIVNKRLAGSSKHVNIVMVDSIGVVKNKNLTSHVGISNEKVYPPQYYLNLTRFYSNTNTIDLDSIYHIIADNKDKRIEFMGIEIATSYYHETMDVLDGIPPSTAILIFCYKYLDMVSVFKYNLRTGKGVVPEYILSLLDVGV
ncbi:MAG: hypothetical protein E6R13_06735 [Spirochaetes bacterium]|nr:MAG: hypothetical protein E6R13_06735 [Spirochaetota bacterium]